MPCDFLIRKNFIVYCYKLCAIRKGFFFNVCAWQPEGVHILRNLHGRGFTHNYEDESYYRNQFWRSVQLKFGHICLEIQPTLAVDICWNFLRLVPRALDSMAKTNSMSLWIRAGLSLSMYLEHLKIDKNFSSILIWTWRRLSQWLSRVVSSIILWDLCRARTVAIRRSSLSGSFRWSSYGCYEIV